MNRPTTFLALAASLAFCAGGVSFGAESDLEAELAQTRDQLWQAREQLWQARNDILDKNRQIDELRAAARPEERGLAQERIQHLESALDAVALVVTKANSLPGAVRAALADKLAKPATGGEDDLERIDQKGQALATAFEALVRQANGTHAERDKILADLERARHELQYTKEALDASHARVVQLQRDIKANEAQLSEREASIADLEEEKAVLEAQLEKCTAAMASAASALPPNTEGKIVGVNPDWSFVVVDIGANQGAALGTELLVSRGDVFLGKIRLVAIRDDVSIAEFLPGAQIDQIMEGDDVLY